MAVTVADVRDAQTRERLAGPAVRAFFRITDAWGLTDQQRIVLLGDSAQRSTLANWKVSPPRTLSVDQMERCSYIVAIYEALTRLFRRDPQPGLEWLQLPRSDPPFLGRSPLALMLEGRVQHLAETRAYLDDATGGPPTRDPDAPFAHDV